MNVLLVEDDADIRELIRWALALDGGFVVEECGAPEQAVAAAARTRAQLALLDVMMPGVDGVSVARQLRADPRTASVAIVFITACVRADDIAAYEEVAPVDVVAKPFDPATLAERLRRAVGAPDREVTAPPEAAAVRAAAQHGYRAGLPERVRAIETALAEAPELQAPAAQRAALLAHRLAGSALLFGLHDVSERARALEDALGRCLLDDAEACRRGIHRLMDDLRSQAAAYAMDAAAASPVRERMPA